MDEAIKQPMESQLLGYPGIGLDVLNQPLAANASRSEVIDHAFAALMSDNFDALNEGMNAVYSTDIGKETLQQANQAAIDHDAQQAQIQQASAPVMKMA